MVVFLGFAAAMIGMLLVSFNSGQVTNAKMRAMNAADAAAYSGAVWEARSLNFQAYMNRAMVVNEVTIAQSVSVRSWVDYIARFISNINMITQFIPYVGEVTIEISQALGQINNAVQNTMPPFEKATRALARLEHDGQLAFHAGGITGAVDIATDVAHKNGATISLGGKALFVENGGRWMNFTDTYNSATAPAGTTGDGRKRLREVARDSRDGFTQNRAWNMDLFVAEIDKQGGTDLVNYDAWKGLDSAALCSGIFKCTWVPVGWGGAQAYRPKTAAIGTHGNNANWNRVDGTLARGVANGSVTPKDVGQAFPNYRDLKILQISKTAQQKVSFAVEVIIADKNVPTANSAFGAKVALTDGTAIEHDPQYVANESGVYGLAEACVSFERPVGAERQDGGIEQPSLFNPYWHASLATPSILTRGTVSFAKGLKGVEALFGGEGSCG